MALRVAELETLFTANIKDFETKSTKVDQAQKSLAKSDPTVKVRAQTTSALAALDQVQAGANKLDATTATAILNADASKATAGVGTATAAVSTIDGMTAKAILDADSTKAIAGVGEAASALRGLDGDTATIKVTADTSSAKADIGNLGGEGKKAGTDAGEGLSAGIVGALATIPIAGAVVGIGAALGKSLLDGLQVELRSDQLMARTDLNPQAVATIARVAGEAYGNNFGDSIAANMDTARIAVQGGLLDPDATARDSQAIIESLSGVADIIGGDIADVSRSTAQLLRTGLATDAAGAFDLIVRGTKAGLDVSGDLLDTINEYSGQFVKLGLQGPEAFGLIRQAVAGGARDTDQAADALKEFSIRAVDGSKTTVAGFEGIGLSAGTMAAAIARGGPEASAALGLTLDKLREVKDPAERAALAVNLFGTQSEDMANALFTMDLSTAVAQLGTVEGAAKTAVATLGDNAAGTIASAQRNIEIAADGIKGALASAFSPQIEGAATFVSENREAVMQFLLDMANGGIDAGRALINGAAGATEAFGDMVGTVGPQVLTLIEGLLEGLERIPGVDLDMPGFRKMKEDAEASFASFDESSSTAAAAIRTNLIENGLDPAQAKLKGLAIPMVTQAALHDASVALATDIDGIGYAGDGTKLALETMNGTVDLSTAAGLTLDGQLRTTVASLDAQAAAAVSAGEDQGALSTRYEEGRVALVNQLTQMGFTGAQAETLAAQYGAIPGKVDTLVSADTAAAAAAAVDVHDKLYAIPENRGVLVTADTDSATSRINTFRKLLEMPDVVITASMRDNPYYAARAAGGTVPALPGGRDEAPVDVETGRVDW